MEDTFIGSTVAKKITVNILNPENEINLENKEISAFAGINEEEIPFGNYIIEKPDNEEVKKRTSFVGYDYMIKFNIPYEDRVKYPCKAGVLFQDVCNQAGLEAGSIDFVNADYMILGNPFTNNEDCRTVLSNIAQLAGGFAKIGRDNKVYIRTLLNLGELLRVKDVHNMPVEELNLIPVYLFSNYEENADEKLDGNNYFSDFCKNNEWGEVNSLVLSISNIEDENTARDDKESIEENGLTEITIEDNPFLINEEERNKVIEPLWEALKGIKYLPFKTEYYGYPYLDSGDAIYVLDTKDSGYISYVFNHTFTFNGAFKGNIETLAMTKTQTAYKNTQDVKSKFKRVERSVDKINGRIEDVIERQDETTEQMSKYEQTVEEISTTVSKKVGEDEIISKINQSAEKVQIDADKISLNGKEINLTGDDIIIKSNNFNVDKQGNMTCANANITGGNISLTGDDETPLLKIYSKNNLNYSAYIRPRAFYSESNGNNAFLSTSLNYGILAMNTNGVSTAGLIGRADNPQLFLQTASSSNTIEVADNKLAVSAHNGMSIKTNNYLTVNNWSGNEIIAFGDAGIFPHRTIDMQGDSIINAGNVSSDRRLKKDIKDSEISAIDRIMAIKHHAFTWKKDDSKEDVGYIAQELEEIDSNYVRHNVTKDEQGNTTFDMYEVRLLPLLSTATKAIQEQQEIIEKQQQFINAITEKLGLQEEYDKIFNDTKVQTFSLEDEEIKEG